MSVSRRQLQDVWSRRPVFAGMLVGGASTRMGRSKSLLGLDGISFAERIIKAVQDRVQRIVLLGDGPAPPVAERILRLPDVPGLAGPLAGMLAALRWAREACWVVVACDLPLLRGEAVDWLLGQRRPDRWAVLPKVVAERVEPLLAVYEPESRELLEKLAACGCLTPGRIADEPTVYTPTPPAPLRACWTNVNTPAELRRLEGDADDRRG